MLRTILVDQVRRRRLSVACVSGLAFALAVTLAVTLVPGAAVAADAVIGSGTAASCQTDQARNDFRLAVAAGGTISFDCGAAPVVIEVDTNPTDKTAVVNGGGNITLDGRDAVQHFYVLGGGSLTLNNITLLDGGGNLGGAIYVDTLGAATVNNSYIVSSGSAATNGGSIYNKGTLTLNNVAIGASNANANGGAIYNAGGTVNVNRTTLRNNQAGQRGGGLYTSGGTVTITNSTIGENRAPGGGGLFLGGGTTTLLNATFGLNRADNGAALWYFGGTASTKNSIFAQSLQLNGSPGTLNCDGSALTSNGRNVVDDGSCITASANDLRNTDARLGGLDLNGGIGATFMPLAGSPALDYAQGCPATDQRGYPRPLGPGCNAGAVERGGLTYLPLLRR